MLYFSLLLCLAFVYSHLGEPFAPPLFVRLTSDNLYLPSCPIFSCPSGSYLTCVFDALGDYRTKCIKRLANSEDQHSSCIPLRLFLARIVFACLKSQVRISVLFRLLPPCPATILVTLYTNRCRYEREHTWQREREKGRDNQEDIDFGRLPVCPPLSATL